MWIATRGWAPSLALMAVGVMLGTPLVGPALATQAQTNGPAAPYTLGAPVDAGDGWMVAVDAATLVPDSAGGGGPAGTGVLMVSLLLQNTGPQPRRFPTYRLRLLSSGGAQQQDTWCGRDRPALELQAEIGPDGTGGGVACWTVSAADTAQVVLALDPPLGHSGEERLALALSPVVQAAPPPPAPAAASAGPMGADPVALPRVDSSLPAPASAQCSTAYSLYADASGGYARPNCTAGSSGLGGASSFVAPTGGSGAALRSEGVPPCRLYPSGAQSSSRTYGQSAVPTTPQPASAATIPSQGGLVGVSC